jgi:nuclear GTP-binding protein
VPPSQADSDAEILLRGVVRTENVKNPAQYVGVALERCQRRHVERTYDVRDWADEEEFLERLARKSGRLLKGGEADVDAVARMVLNDFLRGRLPWFTPPPSKQDGKGEERRKEGDPADGVGLEGREGRLGEMSRKRKREELQRISEDGAKRVGKGAEGEIAEANKESDLEDDEGDLELSDDEDSSDADDSEDEEAEFEGFGDGIAVDPDVIGHLDGRKGEPGGVESQSHSDDSE